MKKIVSWIIVLFALYAMITYFVQKNILSGILMLIAVLLWLPPLDFLDEKLFHKNGTGMLVVKLIISVIILVGASIRVTF